ALQPFCEGQRAGRFLGIRALVRFERRVRVGVGGSAVEEPEHLRDVVLVHAEVVKLLHVLVAQRLVLGLAHAELVAEPGEVGGPTLAQLLGFADVEHHLVQGQGGVALVDGAHYVDLDGPWPSTVFNTFGLTLRNMITHRSGPRLRTSWSTAFGNFTIDRKSTRLN